MRDLEVRSLFKFSTKRSLSRISVLFTSSLYKISIRGLLAMSVQDLYSSPVDGISVRDLLARSPCKLPIRGLLARSLYKLPMRGLLARSLEEISVQAFYKSSVDKISVRDLLARSLYNIFAKSSLYKISLRGLRGKFSVCNFGGQRSALKLCVMRFRPSGM